MMEKQFTVSVLAAEYPMTLSRTMMILTKRKIDIDSISVSECEKKGNYRYILVLRTTEDKVLNIAKQIEKQVDVISAKHHAEEEIVHQEVALYKVAVAGLSKGNDFGTIIRNNQARVLTVEPDFLVIEKTGNKEETRYLLEQLKPFGVLEFVRSGRIAVNKSIIISEY